MAAKTLQVTLQIRSDAANDWAARDPVLGEGEYGLDTTNYLLKIGDGVTSWNNLPYLNKLDAQYFKHLTDGSVTFSDAFATQINNLIAGAGGDVNFIIPDDPTLDTDPVNYSYLRRYIAEAIANAGHLKRSVVESLPVEDIDANTIYMVPNNNGQGYDEYMYIEGAWDSIGTTGDNSGYILPIATANRLGGVKSSTEADHIAVNENTGFMTLNQVSTSLLYIPTGDTLIIYGGTA